jgi:hypothetical protein
MPKCYLTWLLTCLRTTYGRSTLCRLPDTIRLRVISLPIHPHVREKQSSSEQRPRLSLPRFPFPHAPITLPRFGLRYDRQKPSCERSPRGAWLAGWLAGRQAVAPTSGRHRQAGQGRAVPPLKLGLAPSLCLPSCHFPAVFIPTYYLCKYMSTYPHTSVGHVLRSNALVHCRVQPDRILHHQTTHPGHSVSCAWPLACASPHLLRGDTALPCWHPGPI